MQRRHCDEGKAVYALGEAGHELYMVEAEKIMSSPRIVSHISSATLPSRPTYSIDRATLPVIDDAALVARYILLARNQIVTDQTFNIVELSLPRWIKCYIWPVFFCWGTGKPFAGGQDQASPAHPNGPLSAAMNSAR
jgi:hypothetical protein